MSAPNDLILFHYPFSPYARRISWYLALRGVSHAQCLQPPILPRPDLSALNIAYRRIPLLSIGSSVLCDTRLILATLETLDFPGAAPPLGATSPPGRALERLLARWTVDGGVFNRAAQLIPPAMPLLRDPAFLADRTGFSGRAWSVEAQAKGRPEALVAMQDCFALVEDELLGDGREWVAGGKTPGLADVEAVWPFDWLFGMDGALPTELFGEAVYPRTHAWIRRFGKAVKVAKGGKKPVTLKGPEALQTVVKSAKGAIGGRGVDGKDPLGLQAGDEVEVWPIDSGFGHRDRGLLVLLTKDEVAIEVKTKEGGHDIRVHMPRWGFRVQKVGTKAVKL